MATSLDLFAFWDAFKSYPATLSLQDVIDELHAIFAKDRVDIDRVSALLQAYHSNPNDWRRFAIFDQHKYTRNLVDAGNGKFNLMILCWGEGMGSSIHDHANAHCFVKVLDGQLLETQFFWPDSEEEPMKVKEEAVRKTNGVCYMSDEIGLHRVENASHSEGAVSLHLYIPPFMFHHSSGDLKECRTFDERTGHANTVRTTFWSTNGVRKNANVTSCQPENIPNYKPNDNPNLISLN